MKFFKQKSAIHQIVRAETSLDTYAIKPVETTHIGPTSDVEEDGDISWRQRQCHSSISNPADHQAEIDALAIPRVLKLPNVMQDSHIALGRALTEDQASISSSSRTSHRSSYSHGSDHSSATNYTFQKEEPSESCYTYQSRHGDAELQPPLCYDTPYFETRLTNAQSSTPRAVQVEPSGASCELLSTEEKGSDVADRSHMVESGQIIHWHETEKNDVGICKRDPKVTLDGRHKPVGKAPFEVGGIWAETEESKITSLKPSMEYGVRLRRPKKLQEMLLVGSGRACPSTPSSTISSGTSSSNSSTNSTSSRSTLPLGYVPFEPIAPGSLESKVKFYRAPAHYSDKMKHENPDLGMKIQRPRPIGAYKAAQLIRESRSLLDLPCEAGSGKHEGQSATRPLDATLLRAASSEHLPIRRQPLVRNLTSDVILPSCKAIASR